MIEKKGTCSVCGYERKYCICADSTTRDSVAIDKLIRQQKALRDQYNQEAEEFDEYKYARVLRNSRNQEYTWQKGETYKRFTERLEIHANIITERNIRTHMKGPKGPWYSHRRPDGCFMCKDVEMIGYLLDVIKYFAEKYPTLKLE